MAALPGMRAERLMAILVLLQSVLGVRVLLRLLAGRGATRIQAFSALPVAGQHVSVVVPVLDEVDGLAPCLEGMVAQGAETTEILVVDEGSTDGSQDLVRRYQRRDPRVRLVDASPVPPSWNGKAWGLQVGLAHTDPRNEWLLGIAADVQPGPLLARSLVAFALRSRLVALSAATLQEVQSVGGSLLHPAMLTTLIYRYGPPGRVYTRVGQVQANGQCFLVRRDVLAENDGFSVARGSCCEDVTLARSLVASGCPVGFYETEGLVKVRMHADWHGAWHTWRRALSLHDQFYNVRSLIGLCEVTLVQALPLPLLLMRVARQPARRTLRTLTLLNALLAAVRLGTLASTKRAYVKVPWSYWVSPLCDLPVAIALWQSALRRRQVWRGRVLIEERIV